jgi:hypothetical protein
MNQIQTRIVLFVFYSVDVLLPYSGEQLPRAVEESSYHNHPTDPVGCDLR